MIEVEGLSGVDCLWLFTADVGNVSTDVTGLQVWSELIGAWMSPVYAEIDSDNSIHALYLGAVEFGAAWRVVAPVTGFDAAPNVIVPQDGVIV